MVTKLVTKVGNQSRKIRQKCRKINGYQWLPKLVTKPENITIAWLPMVTKQTSKAEMP